MGFKTLLEKQPKSYEKKKAYTFHKLIGEGTFGEVKQATWTQPDGTKVEVAVKCIAKRLVKSNPDVVLDEMEVLRNLSNDHIVKIYDWFESKDKFYLVFELVPGGELFERIIASHHFSEHDAATCVRAILDGVAYLHHRDICHRDLKPENLLLRKKGGALDDIVIADFGVARHLEPETEVKRTLVGSPGYSAPELFAEDGYKGKPADIWSIGVVTYAMLSGTTPYSASDPGKLLKEQLSGKLDFNKPIWKDISKDAKDFIVKCCRVDAEKRLSVDEALSHPWIINECGRSSHNIGEHVKQTLSRQDAPLPMKRDLTPGEREITPDSSDANLPQAAQREASQPVTEKRQVGKDDVEKLGERVQAVKV